MATKGGFRPGAGRKKGQVSAQTEARKKIALKALAEGISPLDVILRSMRAAYKAGDIRNAVACAKEAAPYVHPRLATVQHQGNTEHPLVMSILSSVPRAEEDQPVANGHAASH